MKDPAQLATSAYTIPMKKWLKRWSQWVILALAAAFVAAYAGDWAIFALRGSPRGTVTLNQYVTIPLKGNKKEFDYLGSIAVPCSLSLFPQAGESPCWLLRRNPNPGMGAP